MNDAQMPLDPAKVLATALDPMADIDPGEADQLAQVLSEYEILGSIGRGGMAEVYRARDEKLGRTVAIKVLRQRGADPAFSERFRREARVLAQLDHPNIVTLFDFDERDGVHFLVTDFVDGANLRGLLNPTPPPFEEAVRVLEQICAALEHAHSRGLVHRDVKPENILVDGDGRVRLADFGLVQIVDAEHATVLTATHEAMGTLHYMAPEQLEAPGSVDVRSDVYSLGVVAYELLTGRLPLGRFAAPSTLRPMPVALDDVILRCLAANQRDRFASVREFRAALSAAIAEPDSAAAVAADPSRLNARARASVLYLAIAGIIAGIVGYSLWGTPQSAPQRAALGLASLVVFLSGHALSLIFVDVEWLARARFPASLSLGWRIAYEAVSRGILLWLGVTCIAIGVYMRFTPTSRGMALFTAGVLLPPAFLGVTKLVNSPVWRAAVYEAETQGRQ